MKFCCNNGGGLGGGLERGDSDLAGVGIRGPALLTTVSGVGELLPVLAVLSVLCIDSEVDCSREAGVGLGVALMRDMASGLALLGGRGNDIRELAIFSLCTLAGLVLVGKLGGALSEILKLLFSGQAQLSEDVLSLADWSVVVSLASLFRLLISDKRSDTSLLS